MADGHGHAPGDSAAVWMLALGQTLSYASLYYIFGALIVPIGQGTGWDRPALALGVTLALLISASAIAFNGRLVDRGLGVELLAGGAALGGLSLIALSQVSALWQWYACWAVIGLAASASQYDVCFAFLTRRLGAQARPAIIRVTLVAGLASSLAFSFGAVAGDALGWRGAVLAFAAIQLLATAPLHLGAGMRLRRAERVAGLRPPAPAPGALAAALHQRAFWLMAAIFGLASMNHAMLVTFFIPVFTSLGAGAAVAATAASCVGPAQVAGRIVLMMRGGRVSPLTSTRGALAGLALASLVLLAAGVSLNLIFLFAIAQGASIGMMSILRPVLIADVLGREGFGAISGAIAAVPMVATALAPFAGALLLAAGGSPALVASSLAVAALAVLLSLAVRPRPA